MIPDISRYHASSRQLLVPFDYQSTVKQLWHIKRDARYLFCTGKTNAHNYINDHLTRRMIQEISRYHA